MDWPIQSKVFPMDRRQADILQRAVLCARSIGRETACMGQDSIHYRQRRRAAASIRFYPFIS